MSAGAMQTHTIVQILLLLMRQQDQQQRPAGAILVAAQTNTAVDNILRKLSAAMSDSHTGLLCEPRPAHAILMLGLMHSSKCEHQLFQPPCAKHCQHTANPEAL